MLGLCPAEAVATQRLITLASRFTGTYDPRIHLRAIEWPEQSLFIPIPRDRHYRGARQSREVPEDVVDDHRGVRRIDNVVLVCLAAGIVVHHVSYWRLATCVAPLERSALYC